MREVPVSRLREVLDYDRETGVLRWRHRPEARPCFNARHTGKVAGHLNKNGYVSLRVDRVSLLAHRAIWALVHGEWPSCEIDHRDRNKSNNRLFNLRPASRSNQLANTTLRVDNVARTKGVCWEGRRKRWRATISVSEKQKYLGLFKEIEDAKAAYSKAASETFGEFAS